MSVVQRYPLIIFFVLAYVFSWWPWPLYALGLSPSLIVAFGPFLAAILVLALTGGKAGVVALLRRIVRWRVCGRCGMRWRCCSPWRSAVVQPCSTSCWALSPPRPQSSEPGAVSYQTSSYCCWYLA